MEKGGAGKDDGPYPKAGAELRRKKKRMGAREE